MVKIVPHGTGPSHMQVIFRRGPKRVMSPFRICETLPLPYGCMQPTQTDFGFVIFGFKLWHVSRRLLKVSANFDSGSSGSLCLYHTTIGSLRDYRSPYMMTTG